MNKIRHRRIILKIAPILAIPSLVLACVLIASQTANAQEAMKKGKVRCWVECCPLKIGCEYDFVANARRSAPNAEIIVKGDQLIAEFKPSGNQKVYEVKEETKLDAKTAEVLGFKEITLLPGQYRLTQIGNGMTKVTIKVKAVDGEKKKAEPSN